MATLTLGDGKTYSTFATANSAASDGDTIEWYRNAGDAAFAEGNTTVTKGLNIVGQYDDIRIGTTRNGNLIIGNGGSITETLTFSKINLARSGIALNQTGGNVVFDRCILDLLQGTQIAFGNYTRTGTVTFRNCLFLNGYDYGIRATQGSGGNLIVQNCTFKNFDAEHFTLVIGTNIDDVLIQNCDCIGGSDPFGAITGTLNASSGYNATSGATAAGGNNLTSKELTTGKYIGVLSLPMGILNTSELYHAGTPIVGIATDIFGQARHETTPSIGCFEGDYFSDPIFLNVIENKNYYFNSIQYSGAIPNSAVLSGISYGTLVLDYSEPINTLANDTTSGVQGLISLSSVLSGISAGTLIPDYADPANLLNIDTSSGVTGLLPPSALLSGVGVGTFIPDYSEPINTLANDTTSGVQGLVSLASVLSGVSAGTYVPPTQPSISRVVSGVIYNDGNSEGKFVVPTIAQTQLNVKYGYNEEYTGEFIGTTIQVSPPIITIALNQTTNTTTFSDTYPGATNYLHIRNESSTINNYNPAGSRDGDGIIASSGLERGKHYTFFAASKVGDSYSDAVVSETIVVSRIPASGETTDHSGGWYSGITNNWGDNGSYDPEDSHDSGWYNGIQDIFDE
jgi:hypothetical protein